MTSKPFEYPLENLISQWSEVKRIHKYPLCKVKQWPMSSMPSLLITLRKLQQILSTYASIHSMSAIHIGLNLYYDQLQSVMSSLQDAPVILRGHFPVIPVAGLMTQHLRMIVL